MMNKETYANALSTLLHQVESMQSQIPGTEIGTISLTRRFNPQTGNHVHASTTLKVHFDVSVQDEPQPLKAKY